MPIKKQIIKESTLHQQVVDYLKYQYPKVLFRTDFAAGIKMTIGQAVKHKKIQKCKAWHDLFIEIKKDVREVLLKDGGLRKDEHIQEQAEILRQLSLKGFKAVFGGGF